MKKAYPEEGETIKQILEILNKNRNDKFPTEQIKPSGGLIHKRCPSCGGIVFSSGKGFILEKCSKCGKFYNERRYK